MIPKHDLALKNNIQTGQECTMTHRVFVSSTLSFCLRDSRQTDALHLRHLRWGDFSRATSICSPHPVGDT